MKQMRTIQAAYAEPREQDPDTGMTGQLLRQKAIFGVTAERKYLIEMDMLDMYFDDQLSALKAGERHGL